MQFRLLKGIRFAEPRAGKRTGVNANVPWLPIDEFMIRHIVSSPDPFYFSSMINMA